MNPYEEPSRTSISEACLALWGTPNFGAEFLSEMMKHESDLPLADMCQSGGSPSIDDNAECELLEIDGEAGGMVKGHFHVSFIEESPTRCRDRTWHDRQSGRIDFKLSLKDREVTFEPPTIERHYEPDEF